MARRQRLFFPEQLRMAIARDSGNQSWPDKLSSAQQSF